MNEIQNKRLSVVLNSAFFLFIALLFLTRVLVFIFVNMAYIDTDQPLMWLGARDFSQGIFTEPRFYGQNYNTFMEGIFAVPLLWLDVPVYYAVPAATHFIFLFPFLFTAICLFKYERKAQAIAVLSIVLCMTPAYDIVNSLPRGFVTGTFFSSFFILSLLQPKNLKFTALNTLMSVLGYFVNPSSILASAPVLFYIFLQNYSLRKYYIASGLCLLCVIPLHFFFNGFYLRHPEYVVLPLQLNFSLTHLWVNLLNLPQAFIHLGFFTEQNPIFTIMILLALPFLIFRYDRSAFYSFLLFYGLVIFSCCSDKTREGSDWAFYSFSRMYLAVPIVLGLFVSFIPMKREITAVAIIIITLGFSNFKFATLRSELSKHLSSSRSICVSLMPLKEALHAIDFYKQICKNNGTSELLISNGFWLSSILAYGGPAVDDDFPATQETNSDRRYRVKEDAKTKLVDKFILISAKSDLDKAIEKEKFEIERLDDYGLFLVSNNKLTIADFSFLVRQTEAKL